MEFEVTIKLKVDPSYFYWDLDAADRQYSLSEQVRNVLYELEDVKVTQVLAEEVET
jgi:hypothetical protein